MAIGWYKSIKAILKDEPELWLAYLYGQQLDNIPHLTEIKPRYRGLPIQLLKFSYILMRTWRPLIDDSSCQHGSYFVFAGSSNQMDSLNSTVDALREKDTVVNAFAAKSLLNRKEQRERYIPLVFSSTDILRAVSLLAIRGYSLYRELKTLHPQVVSYCFADFCLIYVYLAYFYRVLSQIQPKFVITANDHTSPNRCMLAVAQHLGIETVYLQHASVSKFFPALQVNYAFLDGNYALDTYRQCEKNMPNTTRDVLVPKVFLSGQKKPILKNIKQEVESIGVALNSLDDIDVAVSFIRQLSDVGYNVVVRWHPGQTERDVKKIRSLSEADSLITFSEPRQESVSDFLFRIKWLLAGNSSIHLEAALASVPSIYYEFIPSSNPDYYGYVRNGVAVEANSIEQVLDFLRRNTIMTSQSRDFVRYYSSTYQTKWEGKEGKLVADILESISNGEQTAIKSLNYFNLNL